MKILLSSILTFTFALALGGGDPVSAKTCRDAKGKFMKCPSTAMTPLTTKKKCRDAKGHFMKCHDSMMMPKKM